MVGPRSGPRPAPRHLALGAPHRCLGEPALQPLVQPAAQPSVLVQLVPQHLVQQAAQALASMQPALPRCLELPAARQRLVPAARQRSAPQQEPTARRHSQHHHHRPTCLAPRARPACLEHHQEASSAPARRVGARCLLGIAACSKGHLLTIGWPLHAAVCSCSSWSAGGTQCQCPAEAACELPPHAPGCHSTACSPVQTPATFLLGFHLVGHTRYHQLILCHDPAVMASTLRTLRTLQAHSAV